VIFAAKNGVYVVQALYTVDSCTKLKAF